MTASSPTVTAARSRFESIDIAKAFAIVLVVIGHFSDPCMPRGYEIAVQVIYMFHMPLFMFASGFLYAATRRPVSYRRFITGKFRRLMVPYFTISAIIMSIKLAMNGVLPLEHPVTWHSWIEILYLPAAGYFLWFIWALWWMMVIIPLFDTPARRRLLLAASLILYFCAGQLPEIFCIRQFGSFLVFFAGGTVVSDYMTQRGIRSFSRLWQAVSVVAFAILAYAVASGETADAGPAAGAIITLTVNTLGIAMSITLARGFLLTASQPLLRATYSVASASYIIYLLHTTFEGFAKGMLSHIGYFGMEPHMLTAWTGAAAVIACGVIIPWWLAQYVLNRWDMTRFLFGLSRPRTQ